MKCPKCSYLGFETGDRCKNCGYDFSLMTPAAAPEEVEVDLSLHLIEEDVSTSPGWLDSIDLHSEIAPVSEAVAEIGAIGAGLIPVEPLPPLVIEDAPIAAAPIAVTPPAVTPLAIAPTAGSHALREVPAPAPRPQPIADAALPLFAPASAEDDPDEPLIKLPAAPRPPLAVRKTPEIPRLRAVPRPAPRIKEVEPELEFAEDPAPPAAAEPGDQPRRITRPVTLGPAGAPGARVAAAAVDHLILLGIDAVVIYLTLRMAGLSLSGWAALPLVPLAAFLLLVKLGYFCAFTAVGGQTIGKMASRLRVVTDAGAPLDSRAAIRRTLAGAVSTAVLGLGFIAALVAADRRALHDRVAGTRVVQLSA